MAEEMERMSLTVSPELIEELDEVIAQWDYSSRSGAIRDALRQFLSEYYWEHEPEQVFRGAVVLIYDHESNHAPETLLSLQHEIPNLIQSVQHVHFDHHLCLETLVVEGPGDDIYTLVNQLRAVKGIKQVRVTTV